MKFIRHKTHFLHRKGFRGRWLTVYLHRYTGRLEETKRFHCHPWSLAISIVLKGGFMEFIPTQTRSIHRKAWSIDFYNRDYEHRVWCGKGLSLFIGLNRIQHRDTNAESLTKEGGAHYTEICQITEKSKIPIESLVNYE